MVVQISSKLHEALLAWAFETPAEEICGLVFGTGDQITDVTKTNNVSARSTDQFEIDPSQLIAAHRAARAGGVQVIGSFHSHPNGVCAPSACDADRAAADGMLWLIIAAGRVGAWRAVDHGAVLGRFDPIDLRRED
jgi:desampylase